MFVTIVTPILILFRRRAFYNDVGKYDFFKIKA